MMSGPSRGSRGYKGLTPIMIYNAFSTDPAQPALPCQCALKAHPDWFERF